VLLYDTNVSEDRAASIFKVKCIKTRFRTYKHALKHPLLSRKFVLWLLNEIKSLINSVSL